jgi:adenylate cyclase
LPGALRDRFSSWLRRFNAPVVPDTSAVENAVARLQREHGKIALVFTDIVDSTALVVEVGDAGWSGILDRHRESARALLQKYGGVEIDATGDSLFCAFERALDALEFAREVQRRPGDPQVLIRAGIHHGAPYFRAVGICGELAHFAARVIGHGKGAEIWLSADARAQLDVELGGDSDRFEWSSDERCRLKGLPGLHTLWRLV